MAVLEAFVHDPLINARIGQMKASNAMATTTKGNKAAATTVDNRNRKKERKRSESSVEDERVLLAQEDARTVDLYQHYASTFSGEGKQLL